MFHRFLFISILGLCFGFLAWTANAADLVVNDAGWVIDCADTKANDGCYEHPECCAEGDFEDLQGEVYDVFSPEELCAKDGAVYYFTIEDGVVVCKPLSFAVSENECKCSVTLEVR